MKHDWEYKKLGEAYILTMGQSPSSDSYNSEGEGLPFFQGCSDFGLIHPTITTFCTAPTKIAQASDVLMSVRAPIGTLNIADTECCIGRGLASFRANKDGVSKFLYYVLKYSKDKLQSLGTGSTFKAIGKDALKKFIVPVPPLPIQQQIVAELDKVSEIIEKKKQQVKELDNLAQSIFYDMFGDPVENEKGWEVKKLENLCDGIGDGLHGTPNYDPLGEVAFINGNNLVDGRIVLNEKTQYVNQSEAKKIFISLNTNTVLLSINGTLGKTAIYNNENVVLGKSACYCRLKSELTPLFVLTLMNTHAFVSYLEDNSSKSTIKNVGLKSIRNYPMILPPLPLQQTFAQKVEAIERQKELITASIKEAQLLFDARMDYWFGE